MKYNLKSDFDVLDSFLTDKHKDSLDIQGVTFSLEADISKPEFLKFARGCLGSILDMLPWGVFVLKCAHTLQDNLEEVLLDLEVKDRNKLEFIVHKCFTSRFQKEHSTKIFINNVEKKKIRKHLVPDWDANRGILLLGNKLEKPLQDSTLNIEAFFDHVIENDVTAYLKNSDACGFSVISTKRNKENNTLILSNLIKGMM